MTARMDIVIVNWNAGDLLRRCLVSLPGAVVDGVSVDRVVVVDNASTDGSIDGLPDIPGLVVLRNSSNRGFAAACNQGAVGSAAKYLLFLNPDTALRSDSLAPATACLDAPENSTVGAVGARLIDESGRTTPSCARFPTLGRLAAQSIGLDRVLPRLFPPHFMSEWDHLDTRPVDQVMGAFLMIRRGLFESLGGFDERFFVYYEDADLCARIRTAGFSTLHVAEAVAVHRGCGTTEKIPETRLLYNQRSKILFAAKHFSLGSALTTAFVTLTVEPLARMTYALARRRLDAAAIAARATVRLWLSIPEMTVNLAHRRIRPKPGSLDRSDRSRARPPDSTP